MTPFTYLTGNAIPFGAPNVDTDVIVPSRFLKRIGRSGLGQIAFYPLRYDHEGQERSDSLFDQARYRDAPILIAGANFGCGSSREQAVWAIADMGIRAVIAPSFSDIFASSAYQNGILTIALPQDQVDRLLTAAVEGEMFVDLPAQSVQTASGEIFSFKINSFRKHCLLKGLL